MIHQGVLLVSMLVQLCAAGVSVWLIKLTGRRMAWALIAAASCLMIARRTMDWVTYTPGLPVSPATVKAEWLALAISLLLLAGLCGIAAMCRDFNDARKALERSENKYRSLFTHMFNGFVLFETVFDEAGKPVDVRYAETNPAFEKLTGLHPEAVIGKRLREVIPDIEKEWISDFNNVAMNGGQMEYERESRALGRTYHVFAFSPGKNQVACLFYDATERRRMGAEIAKFKMICDWANYGIAMIGMDGRMKYVNRFQAETFGYRIDEMIGRPFEDFIPAERREESRKGFGEVGSRGQISSIEMDILHRDGSVIPMLHNAILIRDEFGSPMFVAATSIDMRQMKTLEQQLRQSQKMESIGLLAGGVAHDFNNLLMVILGYAEMAKEELPTNDAASGMMTEILGAGERGRQLVRQLLAFSRRQQLNVEVMNLNAVVGETRQMLKRMVGESIDVEFDLDPALSNVRADMVQIQQILLNLAANGRDAMPSGGRMGIATENVELEEGFLDPSLPMKPGRYVTLSFADTGGGMDWKTQERIFEPFFTTKPHGQGTGLGLATVHGIVRQLGGDVRVESELGIGTIFRIYLPCVPEPVVRPIPEGDEGAQLRGRETILLIEDDIQVRTLARKLLERNGYRVLTAEDAADAIRLFEQHCDEIDLFLSDIVMPVMNGLQVYHALRAGKPALKALFMSGYARQLIGTGADQNAEFPFIQKPFAGQALLQAVRQALEQDGDLDL